VAAGDGRIDGCARNLLGVRQSGVLTVAVVAIESLRALQRAVLDVYVDPSLVGYAVSLAEATREVQQLLDERRPAAAPLRPAAFDPVPLRRSATA